MKDTLIVRKTISYIEAHLSEDLTLDILADALHYSKFYLARTFAENMDCTVYQYIKKRRLTEAARELIQTKRPIADIALEAHYNSQQAFTLAFKRTYACTPYIYREKGVFYPVIKSVMIRSVAERTWNQKVTDAAGNICMAKRGIAA